MVDLDIGTESMRWMGDTRFMVGFLKGLAANKSFKCRLRMKVVESDKVEMARAARDFAREVRGKKVVGQGTDPLADGIKAIHLDERTDGRSSTTPANDVTNGHAEEDEGGLPVARALQPDETWTTIESSGKTSSVKMKSQSEATDMGAATGWLDGEGVLYA